MIVKPRKETDDADETEEAGEYASPACLMHEVDPAYFGLDPAPEAKKGPGAEGAQPPGAAKQDCQNQPPTPAAPGKTKTG